jgi:hypothetical protein
MVEICLYMFVSLKSDCLIVDIGEICGNIMLGTHTSNLIPQMILSSFHIYGDTVDKYVVPIAFDALLFSKTPSNDSCVCSNNNETIAITHPIRHIYCN